MTESDSMLDLARKLMSGETGAVTDFSSVATTADDFITALEDEGFSLWDMVGAGFTGSPVATDEVTSPQVISISFTDAPTRLGRGRKVIPEGTGMLFPELMTTT